MFGSISFVLALDMLALSESEEPAAEAEKEVNASRALNSASCAKGELNKAADEAN